MRNILKILIFVTIGVSAFALFIPQIHSWLSLSSLALDRLYLWQLLTYTFLEPGPLSINFFLQLGFNMYILWTFGAYLIERSRPLTFLILYLGATLIAGLTALAFPHPYLTGSTNAVYAVLIVWMMINRGAQILLFFTLPFKAHWLIAALLGFIFFVNLSASNWLGCASLTASALYSYFFALVVWREPSPFPSLNPFERKFLRLLERKKKTRIYHRSKIFDIKSGEPILDDDSFMDAMLNKISLHGEKSLTAAEKKRMKSISEKKI